MAMSFFKVFLPIYSATQMSIPRAYVNQLEEGLPEKAILRDGTGKSWHVQLGEEDEDLCFKSGWAVFARDHLLERGDFLVFRYCGNSLFHVKIFGLNGCEKEIHDVDINETGNGHVKTKQEDGDHDQAQNIGLTRVHKQKKTEKSAGPSKESPAGSKRKHAAKNHHENRVKENAKLASPRNPQFVRTITEGYLKNMHVPQKFLKAHGLKLKASMLLRTDEKNKWPVKIIVKEDGRSVITGGWTAFVRDNNIKLKDKCVFTLLGTSSPNICKEMHVQVIKYITA